MPDSVRDTLRRLSIDNLDDTAYISGSAGETDVGGGVYEPTPPALLTTAPCSCIPLTADNDTVADRESRAGLFVLVLPVGTLVKEEFTIRVVLLDGREKQLQVNEVLDVYTRDVNVKAYCEEVN